MSPWVSPLPQGYTGYKGPQSPQIHRSTESTGPQVYRVHRSTKTTGPRSPQSPQVHRVHRVHGIHRSTESTESTGPQVHKVHRVHSSTGPQSPITTSMVNCSLTLGYFPVAWKAAVVDPRLKKAYQSASLSNLRPVQKSPIYFKAYGESSVLPNPRAFSAIRAVPNVPVSLSSRP